jgi:arylsulfatase A-like enzyme
LIFALAGAEAATALVALVEASAAGAAGGANPIVEVALADAAVLAPLAASVGVLSAGVSLFLEPTRAKTPFEHATTVRGTPVLLRSRNAALAPLVIACGLAWCVGTAHIARALLAYGAPVASGAALAVTSMALALTLGIVALALLRPLRRALAAGASVAPSLLDPISTGGAAAVAVVAFVAWGIHSGDTGGDGSVLGIFGVLKRGELDLRPVVSLASIAVGAYFAQVAFAWRASVARTSLAALLVAASLVATVHEARAMNVDPGLARGIDRGAPLGRIALHTMRRVTDRDGDGASPFFGGGDCDDRDPRRSPVAFEIPDDGIDQDCSGVDLHLPARALAPKVKPAEAPAKPVVPQDLNVVVITIDTLRTDLGFMGYSKPTSPHLDALAARSVVFERMYSLASYTGKSIGPLFIGKYPSETKRDGGHFNTYFPANTLLAERLKAAGIRTLGAASHWYWYPWSGLTQGIDTFDLSAKPPDGQGDNDTSVTSKELSDAAIRILRKRENTDGRFFLWLHYFDPHEQYQPHPDAPSFGAGNKAAYDGEVWFTDKHLGRVLDFIASQPWGERTAIVVTADHGEAFGEHDMRQHGYELWETLVHVPMIIYVPGVAPHRVPVKRSHIDFVPTILDLMNVPQPADGELSGQSMIDDVMAPSGDGGPHAYPERDVYIDMPVGPFTQMRHALIHGDTPGTKIIHLDNGAFQLFDLARDPDEKEDIAADKTRLGEMVTLFQEKRGSLKEIDVKPVMPTQ